MLPTVKCIMCFVETSMKQQSSLSSKCRRLHTSVVYFSSARKKRTKNENSVNKYVGLSHKRFKRLHGCGFTATGALGIPELPIPENKLRTRPVTSQSFPYRLILDNINNIACGYGYSVFSSRKSDFIKLWGCGLNSDSQIGFHKPTFSKKYRDINIDRESYKYIMAPAPIPLPLKSSKTKVIDIACGRAHTLVLTDSEGVFSLGNNAYGQCGRPIIDGEIYENSRKVHNIPVDHFPSRVVKVVCGMDHSLFLTKDGKVFSCGWGSDGQTGLMDAKSTSEPTLVSGDLKGEKIVELSSFADTTLALSEKNEVFAWGSSEYGQLSCISSSTQVFTPTHLPFKNPQKIKHVAIGGTGCMLIDQDGEVWVWGYGILGKGPDLSNCAWPEKIPLTLFGLSDCNKDVRVIKITCGLGSFAAITNTKELYCWGKNRKGCLGIGAFRNQYFPWKVIVNSEIIDVKCGVDHMIILSKALL